jgi:hypothetical protein
MKIQDLIQKMYKAMCFDHYKTDAYSNYTYKIIDGLLEIADQKVEQIVYVNSQYYFVFSDHEMSDHYDPADYLDDDDMVLELPQTNFREPIKVWTLTRTINDYNQDGSYFVATFQEKPTAKDLVRFMIQHGTDLGFCGLSEQYIEHIVQNGGRKLNEDTWYDLVLVDCY